MVTIEIILCLLFIAVTAYLIVKKVNAPTVLLIMGLLMLAISTTLGIYTPEPKAPTGSKFMDLIKIVEEEFHGSFISLGFMIMTIAGYVAIMNKMKATDAMVYIASKPLAVFRSNPYLASIIVIPIGTLLYLCIPSASGLGLLLVCTIYPILTNIGASKPTALSVIAATIIFDMGPGSANTHFSTKQFGGEPIEYFLQYQVPIVACCVALLMVLYYFSNRYWDKKDAAAGKDIYQKSSSMEKPDVPLWFSIFPVLPLVLLILFSPSVGLVTFKVSTSMVMMTCAIFAILFLLVYNRSVRKAFDAMQSFWSGLGSSFTSVVILTVVAKVFASGLMSLNFVDLLVSGCSSIGMGAAAVTIIFGAVVFFCAIMMGSGNAAFFSFGPMIPEVASTFGVQTVAMILPIQLLAGMGRGISPIAAVIVAIAGYSGVSPMELVKRNLIPILVCAVFLVILDFVFFW